MSKPVPCPICTNPLHFANGVTSRDTIGRKRPLKSMRTLMWCTTSDCPNRIIHNICTRCGAWVPTVDGIPPNHQCKPKGVIINGEKGT